MSRYKPRGKKRPRSWHHGADEAALWEEASERLPSTGAEADPELAEPTPPRRKGDGTNQGDAL